MKRWLWLLPLAGLLGLVLAAGPRIGAGAGHLNEGPVYTVAQLQDDLAQDPAAWVDRPLRVRAIAAVCTAWLGAAHASPCLNWQPALSDPGARAGAQALPLMRGPVPLWATLLRGLPLIWAVVPAPQHPRWEALATYRIQLRAVPCGGSGQPPCYQALLLDAAPGAL